MKKFDPQLLFAAFCFFLVLITLISMALRTLFKGDHNSLLPRPDPRCEREAPKHWRVGTAISGWRRE